MKLLGLNVHEHSSIPNDEVWVMHRKDDGRIPQDLKGKIQVPCVLTGDALQLRRTVTLLRLTDIWRSAEDALTRKRGQRNRGATRCSTR